MKNKEWISFLIYRDILSNLYNVQKKEFFDSICKFDNIYKYTNKKKLLGENKMKLSVEKLYEIADEMEQSIGTEELLLALLKQMNIDELQGALEYIDRMYDTNLFEDL